MHCLLAQAREAVRGSAVRFRPEGSRPRRRLRFAFAQPACSVASSRPSWEGQSCTRRGPAGLREEVWVLVQGLRFVSFQTQRRRSAPDPGPRLSPGAKTEAWASAPPTWASSPPGQSAVQPVACLEPGRQPPGQQPRGQDSARVSSSHLRINRRGVCPEEDRAIAAFLPGLVSGWRASAPRRRVQPQRPIWQ